MIFVQGYCHPLSRTTYRESYSVAHGGLVVPPEGHVPTQHSQHRPEERGARALPDSNQPIQEEVGTGGVQLTSHHHPLAQSSRNQGAARVVVGGVLAPHPRGKGGDPVPAERLSQAGNS